MDSTENNGHVQDQEKLKTARLLYDSGLSLIQVRSDGSKAPASPFKEYCTERAPWNQVEGWLLYLHNDLGILGGKISGNLGILDFDCKNDPDIFKYWKDSVQKRSPGLLERLPVILTPSGGFHAYFRSVNAVVSMDLARSEDDKELIGLRAEGKYCVAPGPMSNGDYRHVSGPFFGLHSRPDI
jgi:hypothetical protein